MRNLITALLCLIWTPALAQQVTYPPLPTLYFSGSLVTSSQSPITSGTWTKVQLNSVMDPGGYWSGTNFNWTPKIPGHYQVCGAAEGLGTTVTDILVAVSKNGLAGGGGTISAEGLNQGLATSTDNAVVSSCQVVAMNGSTDTLELDVNFTGTGTLQVAQGAITSMFIKWISP